MKILLATDGSFYSRKMLKNFAGRTLASNTKIKIIAAFEGASYMMNIGPTGPINEYYNTSNNYSLKLAENAIKIAGAALRKKHPSLSITSAVVEGPPKLVILEEAEKFGADLIVVGSHGYGFVERFLLGSVSQAVAVHAKCSVEIVRN